MTHSSTQLATRRSQLDEAPDVELPVAVDECMPVDDTRRPARARRPITMKALVGGVLSILAAGAVALTAAAMLVGGAAASIFGYALIPDLGMAATVALCWACYAPRPATKALGANALRRAQIEFAKRKQHRGQLDAAALPTAPNNAFSVTQPSCCHTGVPLRADIEYQGESCTS